MTDRALAVAVIVLAAAGAAACGPGDAPAPAGAARRPIVNGTEDTAHPAVVALLYGGAQFCSGTLIAPRAVLTAAHCLVHGNRNPTDVTVFFGDTLGPAGQIVAVTAGAIHPDFYTDEARGAPMNDVAVLTLAGDAPVAPLPWQKHPLTDLVGETVSLVGYGVVDAQTLEGRGTRRIVDQTVIAADDTFIYYTGDQSGTCQGDSGGPMFLDVAGAPVLLGVTSYGDPTCIEFGANTRVARYAAFIAENAGDGVATPPQPVTVSFQTPADGAVIPEGPFTAVVEAGSRAGIAAVELRVDGESHATLAEPPWEFPLEGLAGGEHALAAHARASDEGAGEAAVEIVIEGAEPPRTNDEPGGCSVPRRPAAPRSPGAGLPLLVALLLWPKRRAPFTPPARGPTTREASCRTSSSADRRDRGPLR